MRTLSTIRKSNLLLIGTLLLLLIGYELAFKNTLDLWMVHRDLQRQLAQSADLSMEPGYLARKNKNLDQIISTYKIDSVTFRDNAVNQIASLAEKEQVKLTTVPADDALYHTPTFIIQKLYFEGGFFHLLKLVHTLEDTKGIGMLRSATWKTQKQIPGDTKQPKIGLEIYMEAYR